MAYFQWFFEKKSSKCFFESKIIILVVPPPNGWRRPDNTLRNLTISLAISSSTNANFGILEEFGTVITSGRSYIVPSGLESWCGGPECFL